MPSKNDTWLRQVLRLYLQYMAVGLAWIPAAIVYALLAQNGLDQWWNAAALLAAGLACGYYAWAAAGRHLAPKAAPSAETARMKVSA